MKASVPGRKARSLFLQLSDGEMYRETQLFVHCVDGIKSITVISKNFQVLYVEKVVCVFQA